MSGYTAMDVTSTNSKWRASTIEHHPLFSREPERYRLDQVVALRDPESRFEVMSCPLPLLAKRRQVAKVRMLIASHRREVLEGVNGCECRGAEITSRSSA